MRKVLCYCPYAESVLIIPSMDYRFLRPFLWDNGYKVYSIRKGRLYSLHYGNYVPSVPVRVEDLLAICTENRMQPKQKVRITKNFRLTAKEVINTVILETPYGTIEYCPETRNIKRHVEEVNRQIDELVEDRRPLSYLPALITFLEYCEHARCMVMLCNDELIEYDGITPA